MSKVTLQGTILVPEADLDAVTAALPEHITLTRREPGCLVFEVTPDESRPGRYVIYEEFADAKAFRAHQARVKDSPWGDITHNVERHYTITGLPASRLQPHAMADYGIALTLTLAGIAAVSVIISMGFSLADYAAGVAEVVAAPFYPGLFLAWPPVAALVVLGVVWLGLTRVPRRRWRVPVFLLADVLWVALGLAVIVLWYG